jgi:hypothetical protein
MGVPAPSFLVFFISSYIKQIFLTFHTHTAPGIKKHCNSYLYETYFIKLNPRYRYCACRNSVWIPGVSAAGAGAAHQRYAGARLPAGAGPEPTRSNTCRQHNASQVSHPPSAGRILPLRSKVHRSF